MNIDLDAALSRLADEPPHPRLANLEADVLNMIAAQRRNGRGVHMWLGMLATTGAVSMGLAGSGLSSAGATAQVATLSPFGPSTPLAPSTLLASYE